MVDPKKVDLNQLPKKFADRAIGGFARDTFVFAITSGNQLDPFATTPQIMKSIAVWMNKKVEEYEGQFGAIDMTPPKIISPINMSDLGKSD